MTTPNPRQNFRVAGLALGVSLAMLGLAYASVPLYRLFCQTTGFGGTTQRADKAPDQTAEATVTVRFDANTSGNLDWTFNPVQTAMTVKVGEQAMAHYRAINRSDRTLTGSAIFNVTPDSVGAYFNKIQCFCFTEQTLKAGERVDLPVVFFVDPDILKDADSKAVKEITLSYTFYPVDKPKTVSAVSAAAGAIAN